MRQKIYSLLLSIGLLGIVFGCIEHLAIKNNVFLYLENCINMSENGVKIVKSGSLLISFIVIFWAVNKLLQKYSLRDIVLVSVLIIIMYCPLVLGWGTDFSWEDTENRVMAEMPPSFMIKTDIKGYITELDNYLVDHVPLRKLWLRANGGVKYGVFHSSMKQLAMPGKEGWIYYGASGIGNQEDTVADYMKTNLFTDEELEDIVASLSGIKKYLDLKEIPFFIMINPNKSHVYPEYLPDWLQEGEGDTRAEQLISYLEESTDIQIIYTKDGLLKEKENYLLYCPTDAHWNTVGGYIGFCELMYSIDREVLLPKIEDIVPVYEKTDWGDVANIANAAWFTNNLWTTTSYKTDVVTEWVPGSEENNSLFIHNENGNGKKILVYHDSFMNQMKDYLGKEFSECEFIEKDFQITEKDIEAKKPDIIVFEMLERFVNNYTDDIRYWQKYN